jgi:hypothetical protein
MNMIIRNKSLLLHTDWMTTCYARWQKIIFVSELVRFLDQSPVATCLMDVELRLLYLVINFHTYAIKEKTPTEKKQNTPYG